MRFREVKQEDLARARAAVSAWREHNPTGSYEQVVTDLVGFHKDYGPILRAMLFRLDRNRAHEITGVRAGRPEAGR